MKWLILCVCILSQTAWALPPLPEEKDMYEAIGKPIRRYVRKDGYGIIYYYKKDMTRQLEVNQDGLHLLWFDHGKPNDPDSAWALKVVKAITKGDGFEVRMMLNNEPVNFGEWSRKVRIPAQGECGELSGPPGQQDRMCSIGFFPQP